MAVLALRVGRASIPRHRLPRKPWRTLQPLRPVALSRQARHERRIGARHRSPQAGRCLKMLMPTSGRCRRFLECSASGRDRQMNSSASHSSDRDRCQAVYQTVEDQGLPLASEVASVRYWFSSSGCCTRTTFSVTRGSLHETDRSCRQSRHPDARHNAASRLTRFSDRRGDDVPGSRHCAQHCAVSASRPRGPSTRGAGGHSIPWTPT